MSDLTATMHSRPQNAHASAWRQRARQKGSLANDKVRRYHQQGARHEYVGLQVFKADLNRYPFQDKYYERSLNKVVFQRSLLELLNNRSRFFGSSLLPVYDGNASMQAVSRQAMTVLPDGLCTAGDTLLAHCPTLPDIPLSP
ncbi:hypothetical protein GGI16_006205 [Coemansia sp. S142-1]|nr:hypothetical protein GGI16_006205 [Coemansia sp. S142-1]